MIRRLRALPLVLAAVAFLACSGDSDDEQAQQDGGDPAAYSGVVVTTELTTGVNRFSIGVIDNSENQPIAGADVSLRFFKILEGNQAQLRAEAEAEEVVMERGYVDNTGELVSSGQIAVYVASPEFDETGDWGVEISGTVQGNGIGPINLTFGVAQPEQVLNVGDPAPKSRQQISRDVQDIAEIDTMQPPDPMHDMTIEEAVMSGRPTVILFGTPAFCETLTCGPVMQSVMLPLYEEFRERANFIHVEPYFVEEVRRGEGLCAVPAFNLEFARAGVSEGGGACPAVAEEQIEAVGESWNLAIEPVIFVVDGDGNIAGKFEGVTGLQEVERVLTSLQ